MEEIWEKVVRTHWVGFEKDAYAYELLFYWLASCKTGRFRASVHDD